MKIMDILVRDAVILNLDVRTKREALEEMSAALAKVEPQIEADRLLEVLLEREALQSTGIGEGVAIPHGKYNGLSQPMVSFGRSHRGLDFESMDGQPAFLFFLLVAPENSTSIHLKALARIAKILKSSSFRKALMEVPTKEELYQTIIQNDDEF